MIQSIENGGLKLADFSARIQAARMMWVKRIFLDGDSFSFHFLAHLTGSPGVGTIMHGKPSSLPPRPKPPPFILKFLTFGTNCTQPVSESEVRWEVLWFNKRVTIEGSPYRWDKWWRRGIMRIEDLLHETEGRLLSHTELSDKLGIPVTFLEALQSRQSIPHLWTSPLSPQGQTPQTEGLYVSIIEGQPIDVVSTSPAVLYSKTLSKDIKAQAKWRSAFHDAPALEDWPALYRNPFRVTRETRLQAFQFKILHRTLPCRSFLKAIQVVLSDACPFCSEKDDVQHFLYHCRNTKRLWENIQAWSRRVGGPDLSSLSPSQVILGILPNQGPALMINFISLYQVLYT